MGRYRKHEISTYDADEDFFEEFQDGELIELEVFLRENHAPELATMEAKQEFVDRVL